MSRKKAENFVLNITNEMVQRTLELLLFSKKATLRNPQKETSHRAVDPKPNETFHCVERLKD